MSNEDLEDLRRAKRLLETLSLAARLGNAVGRRFEALLRALPPGLTELANTAARNALERSLAVAVWSLRERPMMNANAIHKGIVGAVGAVGGLFGMPALIPELTASTTVMLRSIAEIARSEGDSLESPESRLACLQVFALGGPTTRDDAVETGYFAVRAAMATALEEAAEHIAKHGLSRRSAPVLVRFIAQIAARFGAPVSEKVIAQSVPVVGSLGGASINVIFLAHFQDMARGHFIVRRLERKYGIETVRNAYAALSSR